VDDDEILRVFRESPDPALFATEVADEIGYTRQGVNNRLDELVRRGELVRKKSGPKSVVYWLPESDSE
jgi:DNA-binding MarR family transcriptional regulator